MTTTITETKVTITVSDQQLAAALCNGCEGGTTTEWAELNSYTLNTSGVYDYEGVAAGSCSWDLGDLEDDVTLTLDREALQRGLQVLAEKYPSKFVEILDENKCDADTGDALIQCSLLGDIIYG